MADGRAIGKGRRKSPARLLFTGSLVPWMVGNAQLKSQVKRDTLVSVSGGLPFAYIGQYVSHGLDSCTDRRREAQTGAVDRLGWLRRKRPPFCRRFSWSWNTNRWRHATLPRQLYASTYHFPALLVVPRLPYGRRGGRRRYHQPRRTRPFRCREQWYVPFMAQVEQVFRTNISPETGADILLKLGTLLACQMSAVNGGRVGGNGRGGISFRLSSKVISRWDSAYRGNTRYSLLSQYYYKLLDRK